MKGFEQTGDMMTDDIKNDSTENKNGVQEQVQKHEDQQEVTAIIQSTNNGTSVQDGSSRCVEMWRNSEYILKVDPTRFPDELDMNVREKRVKDDSQVYCNQKLQMNVFWGKDKFSFG